LARSSAKQGASRPPSTTSRSSTRDPLLVTRLHDALRRISQSFERHSRQLSHHHGLTGPQLVTLLAISQHEPLGVSEVSRIVSLSASTMVGILDRLADKGLIVRERSESDRRRVMLRATAQGRHAAAHAPPLFSDGLSMSLGQLRRAELRTLAHYLERVASGLPAPGAQAGRIRPQGTAPRPRKTASRAGSSSSSRRSRQS
jgi:DNA-binding MarR family transcriptional regulator